ncbi:histone-lysine N-methyltransferase, H3 lysine-36 specific [[Candida] anglica]
MLYLDYEDKTAEALQSFQELAECNYTRKNIGSSGQNEIMTCDCVEEWNSENQCNMACGEDSDCINRVTSVECVNSQCTCGENCQNQRFQRKQYAQVAVIQTEKKGYGLRAQEDIPEAGFVYEYIGEVIDEPTFRKRMIEYDTNKFKHFYFMMLKKDSFIDATVKGSLARFCNHSCNPNAYVDKWVVGDKLKMGIFAKRKILKGEEITFDYNVDRYGAQSQPCYCGEKNCLKFMGGKTQTDSALLLPEGISEALGVTHQQEKQWLKENKHLRSKQQSDDSIINEAFVNSIKVGEITNSENVSKVMGALMKSQDRYIVSKLIRRIYLTNDSNVNSSIIRMHGYKTMSQLLKGFRSTEEDLVEMILEILLKWPKVTKNKISSSEIEDVVKEIEKSTKDSTIKRLSASLLREWGNLQMAYRIPKNFSRDSESPAVYGRVHGSRSRSPERVDHTNGNNSNAGDEEAEIVDVEDLPEGWEYAVDPESLSTYYFHRGLNISRWDKPTGAIPRGPRSTLTAEQTNSNGNGTPERHSNNKRKDEHHNGHNHHNSSNNNNNNNNNNKNNNNNNNKENPEVLYAQREEERLKKERERQFQELQAKDKLLQELIKKSQQEAEEKRLLEEKIRQDAIEKEKERQRQKYQRSSQGRKSSRGTEGNSANSQWTRLFAKCVPNMVKKHEQEIGHESLKSCAKDIVKILVEKEIKKSSTPPTELDKHKLKKVNEFSRIYMEKFLVKYRTKNSKRKNSEGSSTMAKKSRVE